MASQGGPTMASVGGPSAQMHNTPSTASSTVDDSIDNRSWEGDRMLHIYMLDYCKKRRFHAVANALSQQANIEENVPAPINAPQGLLFEWWVVFWDIFTAKNNEHGGSRGAVSYAKTMNLGRQDHTRASQWPQGPQVVMHPNGAPLPIHPNQPMPMVNGTGQPGTALSMAQHPTHNPPRAPFPPPQGQAFSQQPGHPPPNGILPPSLPGQPHHPQAPPPTNINGPQPYPPNQQSLQQQQQPHPNQPHHPTGAPHPNSQQPSPHPNAPFQHPQQQQNMARQQMRASQGPPGGPPFGAGSPMDGPGPSPRVPNMGHPQHQQHPSNGGQQPNGMPGNSSGTPTLTSQMLHNNGGGMSNPGGRPQSRTGTPGASSMGMGSGMSPSRNGNQNQMGMQQRPQSSHSHMGNQQFPPGFNGQMNTGPPNAGGPYGLGPVPPQIMEQALKQAELHGKDPSTFTQDDRAKLHKTVQRMQNPGGTPRMTTAGNPMGAPPGTPGTTNMNPPPQPSQGNIQGGFNPNFAHAQQAMAQQQQNQHNAFLANKRPASPPTTAFQQLNSSPRDLSPPDQKRMRRNSQGTGANAMHGYAPNAPPGQQPGQQQQQQQPPPPPGQQQFNGNMGGMRPQPGPGGMPGGGGNMMPNGGNPTNPNQQQPSQQQQPSLGNSNQQQLRQPPPGGMRYNTQLPLPNSRVAVIANPHTSGLPLLVQKTESSPDLGPHGHPGNRIGGTKPGMMPSPAIPSAKAPGMMPPPSHTPQPGNKEKVKDEPSGTMNLMENGPGGSAKSSPNSKPLVPPTTINPSATPGPTTPIPGSVNPSILGSSNSFSSSSSAVPTPSAILASMTPPNHTPRPGSSTNATSMGNMSGVNPNLVAPHFSFSGMGGMDTFSSSLNFLDSYNLGSLGDQTLSGPFGTGKDEPFEFDQYLDILGQPDDDSVTTGGIGG